MFKESVCLNFVYNETISIVASFSWASPSSVFWELSETFKMEFERGLKMRATKATLKEKIKELASEGRRIRIEEIRKNSGLKRADAWNKKRFVGSKARLYLLAYAFVRGKKYHNLEPKSFINFSIYDLVRIITCFDINNSDITKKEDRDEEREIAESLSNWLSSPTIASVEVPQAAE